MNRILESAIEEYAIELLQSQRFDYIYGPDIAPDSDNPERESFEDVILIDRLRSAVQRINPSISCDAQEDAVKQIQRINSPELISNNEDFHKGLTEGITVETYKNGEQRGDKVWLIDFENPDKNEYLAVNQFTIIENHVNKRPDIILFINGLPLVVIELKNAVDENATMQSAFRQFQTYKDTIPSLFTYNSFLVISDGHEAKAGTISSGMSRFMAWKTSDGFAEASSTVSQIETLIKGMLNRRTLLDLIRHFIVFEETTRVDRKTGLNQKQTVKKLAAYHQYCAVNKAVESTLRASGYTHKQQEYSDIAAEKPKSHGLYSVEKQPYGDKKGGVVWHTQGSGKSLSMVFYTGKIVLALDNPTILGHHRQK